MHLQQPGSVEGVVAVRDPGAERDDEVASLFRAHYAPMCRLAYVILGDRELAEEIVMEALLKTFSGWGRLRDPGRSGAYLRRAVVNLCRSRLRRRALEARVNAAVHRGDESRPSPGSHEARETRLAVWDAVRSLPERQRMCVVLRYFEDLPEAEIADVMACSTGTVKSQLSKARARLARVLEDQGLGGSA